MIRVIRGRERAPLSRMRLTRSADYALSAATHLATLPFERLASGAEIAIAVGISEPFLLKVLRLLVRARLVHAQRGARGGFRLNVTASAISMLQVIEAVDGPFEVAACMMDDHPCSRKRYCRIYPVICQLQRQTMQILESVSIAQLAQDGDAQRVPAREALDQVRKIGHEAIEQVDVFGCKRQSALPAEGNHRSPEHPCLA
jgi:Rrf2 family protein